MGEKLRLSMDDMTLEDMELFEDATGRDMMEVLKPRPVIDEETGRPMKDPDDPKGRPLMAPQVTSKAFIGLVYVAKHRENPALTVAEVKAMKLSDIDFEIEPESGSVDPTEPADEPPISLSE
jgi:hypothetical protein